MSDAPCTRAHGASEECAGCVARRGGDLLAYFEMALGRQLPPPNPDAMNVVPR